MVMVVYSSSDQSMDALKVFGHAEVVQMNTIVLQRVRRLADDSTSLTPEVMLRRGVEELRVDLLDVQESIWRVRRPRQQLCHLDGTVSYTHLTLPTNREV